MNILYYSVHQILEYDEVRLLKSLGHNVFCLGYSRKSWATQNFRPAIDFSPAEQNLFDIYEHLGGRFHETTNPNEILPDGFIDHFSCIVVMHDTDFIRNFWQTLRKRPVVWRTIGQGVADLEDRMRPFRNDGLKIVRYAEIETEVTNSLGQDEVIRFYKDPDVYHGWNGTDACILTFSNDFMKRYPSDYEDYCHIVEGLPTKLGGSGNTSNRHSIGMADYQSQMSLYRDARCYLYASGLGIPYTLNFIEAWMTGIPLVVHAPINRRGRYFEIDRLVDHGKTGFICESVAATRKILSQLVADRDLAADIGRAGRTAAIQFFGNGEIKSKWGSLLDCLEQAS